MEKPIYMFFVVLRYTINRFGFIFKNVRFVALQIVISVRGRRREIYSWSNDALPTKYTASDCMRTWKCKVKKAITR